MGKFECGRLKGNPCGPLRPNTINVTMPSGYRQQARVENSFFRYKSVFGGDLKARHSKAQRREAAIGCHILNRMAELGRPSSYALGR